MIVALIQDFVVQAVQDLTEEQILDAGRRFQAVIDVSYYNPHPPVGSIWNGRDGFTNPNGSAIAQSRIITKLAFRNRLSMQEKATMYAAMATPQGVGLKVYVDDLAAATFVDLNRADTIGGVQALVAYGFLTPERASEILNADIQPHERYVG
jgi:hypothetical protein